MIPTPNQAPIRPEVVVSMLMNRQLVPPFRYVDTGDDKYQVKDLAGNILGTFNSMDETANYLNKITALIKGLLGRLK